jgi:hypothetical protein
MICLLVQPGVDRVQLPGVRRICSPGERDLGCQYDLYGSAAAGQLKPTLPLAKGQDVRDEFRWFKGAALEQ